MGMPAEDLAQNEEKGVFISYRHSDAGEFAKLAFLLLNQRLRDLVFLDEEVIRPGSVVAERISAEMKRCKILLVLIGPDWNPERLNDEGDWVRLELSLALARQLRIIPIILPGGRLPERSALPPEFRTLVDFRAYKILGLSAREDFERLAHEVERVLFPARSPTESIRIPANPVDPKPLEGGHEKFEEHANKVGTWQTISPQQQPPPRPQSISNRWAHVLAVASTLAAIVIYVGKSRQDPAVPARPAPVSQGTEEAQKASPPPTQTLPPAEKPSLLIVDPGHHGHYTTISEAIAAAVPGSQILIRPGLYQEALVIDKPLDIINGGTLGDVIIEAMDESVISFDASLGRISGVQLRQLGEGSGGYTVEIQGGYLILEECDISSQSGAAVSITSSAQPLLRRNRIHDSAEGGIDILENGRALLEDNELFTNGVAGVSILDGGSAILRRNRIRDGVKVGVLVGEGGRATLEDNDIFANALAGVSIMTGSTVTLRRNRIHDGRDDGVNIHAEEEQAQGSEEDAGESAYGDEAEAEEPHERSQTLLEDNDIFANGGDGVGLAEGYSSTLRNNRVHDNTGDGIYFHGDGWALLEGNELFANHQSGVLIESGEPELKKNQIHDNREQGVFFNWSDVGELKRCADKPESEETAEDAEEAPEETGAAEPRTAPKKLVYKGLLESNTISANAMSGVKIRGNGSATLRGNQINGNKGVAIRVECARGTIENNDLRGNNMGPWHILEKNRQFLTRADNRQ